MTKPIQSNRCRNVYLLHTITTQMPVAWLAIVLVLPYFTAFGAENTSRPNVVLILADDQGWGDFGFHGNPQLKTPHLDRLAGQSTELTRFHVCPVCSPTRASLLTGRYNYRTGAIDTFLGRSTMVTEEVTLAEMLATAGYRTGIFGKWHLGDNYPSRPGDQGFAESLVHRGGGIGQASDPPGNSYFDPALLPLQVPQEYHRRYQGMGLDEDTAKLYGMVANIDDNLGRLFAKLQELKLDESTIVVFLTDNGPQSHRYNGVLNDLKGSVHDGGIRVPCLVRLPGQIAAGAKIDQVAAHIDLTPTLLEACSVARPANVALDGVSLWPLLLGKQTALAERTLFFQWHRGDVPERDRACAARSRRYKLVQPAGREGASPLKPAWALYDMIADPGERQNLIDAQADVAANLRSLVRRRQ